MQTYAAEGYGGEDAVEGAEGEGAVRGEGAAVEGGFWGRYREV